MGDTAGRGDGEWIQVQCELDGGTENRIFH